MPTNIRHCVFPSESSQRWASQSPPHCSAEKYFSNSFSKGVSFKAIALSEPENMKLNSDRPWVNQAGNRKGKKLGLCPKPCCLANFWSEPSSLSPLSISPFLSPRLALLIHLDTGPVRPPQLQLFPTFELRYCYKLTVFEHPPPTHTHNWIPSVLAFRHGPCGRQLGHESRTLWMGLAASWKRVRGAPSLLPLCEDTARRLMSGNEEVDSHQTLNLLAPCSWTYKSLKLWERNFCCL